MLACFPKSQFTEALWAWRRAPAILVLVCGACACLTGSSAFGQCSNSGDDPPAQCAQHCIKYICALNGVPATLEDACSLLPPKPSGESMLELAEALEKLGFAAQGKRIDWDSLQAEQLPVIAHYADNHFVVVEQFIEGYVAVLDGRGARRLIRKETFRRNWGGHVLAVSSPHDGRMLPANVPAPSAGEPRIRFKTLFLDCGDLETERGHVIFEFPFTNTGKADLRIEAITVSCGCMAPAYPKEGIPAGGGGTITIDYDLRGAAGPFGKAAIVRTNDPQFPAVLLNVAGFADKKLSVRPEFLHLGRVVLGHTVQAVCFVRYWSREELELGTPTCDMPGVEARVEQVSEELIRRVFHGARPVAGVSLGRYENFYMLTLSCTPTSATPMGPQRCSVRLPTNLPGRKAIDITASMEILPSVQAKPSVLFLGSVTEGAAVEATLHLVSAGTPFEVAVVDTGGSGLVATVRTIDSYTKELRVSGVARDAASLNRQSVRLSIRTDNVPETAEMAIPIRAYADKHAD
ncbi:MAG: DUF1573 domain-containing protein [Planctomycetes bacterium]|nr:DUF1573 domain-containing protein [Planctomycetota bacterium]